MSTGSEILLVSSRFADLTLHFRGASYHLNTYAACNQSSVLDGAISALENDDWTEICELTERCKHPGHRCLSVADNGELDQSSKRTIYQIINPIVAEDFQSFLELLVDPALLLKAVPSWSLPAWRAALKTGDQVRFAKTGHDNGLAYRAAEVLSRRGEFFELKYQSHTHPTGYKIASVHWHMIFQTGCIPPPREERLDTFLQKHSRSFKLAIQFKCDSLLTCFEKRINQILSVELPSPKPRVFEGLWHLIGLIDTLDDNDWSSIKQAVMDALSFDEHPDQRAAYKMVFGSCLSVNTRAKMLSDRANEAAKMEQMQQKAVVAPVSPSTKPTKYAYQIPSIPSQSADSRLERLSTIVDIRL